MIPELTNEQLILVAIAAAVACWLASQLVNLVRVLLNREVIDQDPQLAEVIERLDKLVDYAHDTFAIAESTEQEAHELRDRDDRQAENVADIATVLGHWHAATVLSEPLDTIAARRAARGIITAEQAEAIRAVMNRGGQP